MSGCRRNKKDKPQFIQDAAIDEAARHVSIDVISRHVGYIEQLWCNDQSIQLCMELSVCQSSIPPTSYKCVCVCECILYIFTHTTVLKGSWPSSTRVIIWPVFLPSYRLISREREYGHRGHLSKDESHVQNEPSIQNTLTLHSKGEKNPRNRIK